MPEKRTAAKAKRDLKEGKYATTAAGKFVHQEIEHVRKGKHGARSPKQAIAIGLSEARRAGVPVQPPRKRKGSSSTRRKAERDYERGQASPKTHSRRTSPRSRSRTKVLKRESRSTAGHSALSRQAKSAARRRRGASH